MWDMTCLILVLPSFDNQQGDRCGSCHTELQTAYRMSMHGALERSWLHRRCQVLGLPRRSRHPALVRSEFHDGSRQSDRHLCDVPSRHLRELVSFDPHANHRDPKRSALVFWVYRGVLTFIIVVFGFFGTHSVFWFVRGVIDVLQNGRPPALTPNVPGYTRFTRFHRVAHTVMVVSFLGLALTGLPLKFSNYQWAQWLAYVLGGFSSHRVLAPLLFGHHVRLLCRLCDSSVTLLSCRHAETEPRDSAAFSDLIRQCPICATRRICGHGQMVCWTRPAPNF